MENSEENIHVNIGAERVHKFLFLLLPSKVS